MGAVCAGSQLSRKFLLKMFRLNIFWCVLVAAVAGIVHVHVVGVAGLAGGFALATMIQRKIVRLKAAGVRPG
jgi:hypothetical protein